MEEKMLVNAVLFGVNTCCAVVLLRERDWRFVVGLLCAFAAVLSAVSLVADCVKV